MSLLVVDASVWVARFVPQDEFHGRVRSWLDRQRLTGNKFLAPALLLTEVAGAISRRTGAIALGKRTAERLDSLPGLRLVQMDQTLVREATRLAAELDLRGADAYYIAVADRLEIPLVTLDNDQGQRASNRVIVHIPSDEP
jgi:predicted nucleic acid-binding protein